MNRQQKKLIDTGRFILLSTVLAAGSALTILARADEDSYNAPDSLPASEMSQPADTANESTGPVRLARFTYTSGDVSWRADSSLSWAIASVNLPIRQGAQIYVPRGSRAELQFDDGSMLRMAEGAVVTLQTLYSDADGEYTQLKQTDGQISMKILHNVSVYQIDTPFLSAKASGPTSLRIGVGDRELIEVPSGKATIEGRQGKVTLSAGDALNLRDEESAFDAIPLGNPDSFDRWTIDRDREIGANSADANRYLPSEVAQAAPEIDRYGTWNDVPEYGHVWCPRVASDWRPYHYGHWVMCAPFGWTWVSDEPWGWAPYHYGTWCQTSFGWGWCPGPARQCWSPAVVSFCEFGGNLCWVPLHPREVRYSSLNLGFHSENWNLFFSIGQAGVFYPNSHGYFEPRRWNSHFVNHTTINNTFVFNRGADLRQPLGYDPRNRNTMLTSSFVPRNAQMGKGATMTSVNDFGNRGQFKNVGREDRTIFAQGRTVGSPLPGQMPSAGPIVRVTPQAIIGDRVAPAHAQAPATLVARQVYQSRPPVSVQREFPQRNYTQTGIGSNRTDNSNRLGTERATGSLPTARTDRTPPVISNGRGNTSDRFGGNASSRPSTVNPPSNDRVLPNPDRSTNSAGTFRSENNSAREAASRARESLGLSSRTNGSGFSSRSQSSTGNGNNSSVNHEPGSYAGRYSSRTDANTGSGDRASSNRQRDAAPAPSTDRPTYRQRDSSSTFGTDRASGTDRPTYRQRDSSNTYGSDRASGTDRPSYRQRDSAPAPSTDRPSYRQRDTSPSPSVDRPSYRQRDTTPAPSVDRPSYRQRDPSPSPSYRQRDPAPAPRAESSRGSDRAAPAPRADSSSKDSSSTKKK